MNKITHHFSKLNEACKQFTLTTPKAILIGAIIIALSILSLGSMGYQISITRVGPTIAASNPLPSILKAVGINKNDFAKCVDSDERAQDVAQSTNDGVAAGVNGTPATFILREEGGIFYTVANISGAQSEEFFTQAIDQALALTNVSKLTKFDGRAIDQNDLQEVSTPTKVYVVEYSDAECPFCTRLHPTMKDIRTAYAGKISFVYRNFPLTSIHPHAQKEAEMISCVGMLGGAKAYYPFIDAVFDWKIKNNQGYLPWGNN